MARFKPTDEWTRAEKDAARAILLEPSPYDADGGELIGRDPRRISTAEFDEAGIDGAAILAVIRAKCLDCCVQQEAEVRKCVAILCPNWPYRTGVNPFRSVNISEAERERRSERGKALGAARAKRLEANFTSEDPTADPDGQ